MICVSGCITKLTDNGCIEPKVYTDNELQDLENAFKVMQNFLIDYGNERERLRKLNETKINPLL